MGRAGNLRICARAPSVFCSRVATGRVRAAHRRRGYNSSAAPPRKNPKPQANAKLLNLKSTRRKFGVFGPWDLGFVWDLDFGGLDLSGSCAICLGFGF